MSHITIISSSSKGPVANNIPTYPVVVSDQPETVTVNRGKNQN
jgi:hypothetical protein